jgi:photosystem II stability/assembly factor-like uncharacterized protein
VHAAISRDGGSTWDALASEPAGSDAGGGTIAISADGKTIVWTPRRGASSFSADWGQNWKTCAGLSQGFRVIADPMNPWRFYAFDARTAKVFASTNGAESFFQTGADLPTQDGPGFFITCFSAAPGVERDLWLAFGTNGLFHSTDGGANFTKAKNVRGAASIGFGKAAPGKNFPALNLAGKIGSAEGLFRSLDSGTTWSRINDDQHQYGAISRVTGDPRVFGRVYFATSGRGIIYGDEVNSL